VANHLLILIYRPQGICHVITYKSGTVGLNHVDGRNIWPVNNSFNPSAQEQAEPSTPDTALTDPLAEAAQNFAPDLVVATIGGKDLTTADLDNYVRFVSPGTDETLGARRLHTLRALVTVWALAGEAVQEGMDQTAEFKTRLELMRLSALQEAFVSAKLAGKVTEEDVKARYEVEIKTLPAEEEVRASHILVESEDEAKKVIVRLDEGEDFAALAQEKSTDGSSAASGGDLNYFSKGQMVEPFENAAFALNVGEYSKQPIESPFGWHVIKLADRRTKEPPSLEEFASAISNMLMREHYDALIDEAIKTIGVTYGDEAVTQFMQKKDEE